VLLAPWKQAWSIQSVHTPALLNLSVENFRSLQKVEVELGSLNVLVGPNGAGKTNLLKVIEFLGDAAREDLGPAIEKHGGLEAVHFRGAQGKNHIRIGVKVRITPHASKSAPDEYTLDIRFRPLERVMVRTETISFAGGGPEKTWTSNEQILLKATLSRSESFTFKRQKGAGRRITIKGSNVELIDPGVKTRHSSKLLRSDSLGLSTLPRLDAARGGKEVGKLAELFSTFRVMDINVDKARKPSELMDLPQLRPDASNLAGFLFHLSKDVERFALLQEDVRAFVPGMKALHLRTIGGASDAVVVELEEEGLPGRTPLADASFGTVRAIALLAMLHDPNPPQLTCVEEIDHGLHPYVFDRLVERLRSASKKTQFLIATHSPALVNRLSANELIVCERAPHTGASRIPAISQRDVARMVTEVGDNLRLGELWFSGSLGGVPSE
jgi:predicted ATPase